MNNTLGAHEVMELHEVLNDAIHGLNTLQLYRPFARDPQLQSMMNSHIQACMMEYNNMVQMAQQAGASEALPAGGQRMMNRISNGNMHQMNLSQTNHANPSFQPTYGLRNPQTQAPAQSPDQIDDSDVAICIVTCHKQSAALKMKAALEMANPTLRQLIQNGANKSADMAYEGFQYANQRGFYQVPTLKDTTTNTYMQSYGTTQMADTQQAGNRYM